MADDGLRRGVLGLVALGAAGLPVELLLVEHTHAPIQWVPFALCALLLVGVGLAWRARAGWQRIAALGLGGLNVVGALFGMWEHVEHNYGFQAEIHPTSSFSELIGPTLTGASPALAPAALALLGLFLMLTVIYSPKGGSAAS